MKGSAGGDSVEIVDVVYALHDAKGRYSKFTGASMWSLFMHTKAAVHIHLLHDETLCRENRSFFMQCADYFGQSISFYPMQSLAEEQLEDFKARLPDKAASRYTAAAFYRLLAGSILPADVRRYIYLDADTIVNLDILELWREEAEGLAAVAEAAVTGEASNVWLCQVGCVPGERYFNSGVLLVEREGVPGSSVIWEGGMELLQRFPEQQLFDQDILNFFFADSYTELSPRFNFFPAVNQRKRKQVIEAFIYHYDAYSLGMFRPNDVYDRLFYDVFCQTPWCNTDFLMRTFSVIEQLGQGRLFDPELLREL